MEEEIKEEADNSQIEEKVEGEKEAESENKGEASLDESSEQQN